MNVCKAVAYLSNFTETNIIGVLITAISLFWNSASFNILEVILCFEDNVFQAIEQSLFELELF